MPTNTANLNLFKYGSTDGARTFNIDEALNANWDKIDEAVAKKYTKAPTGIPELDLDSAVKAALGKARTALQSVTKADVGLGNVDNTSDASKPISNAQATKFGEVEGALTTHQADLAHVHWIGTAVGINTLTATYEPITILKNGLGVAFLNTTSSTLATTLNINNLGAIPILKANGNPVTNLKANGIYTLRYANGNFILQGEGGEYGTATASDVLKGKTFGTENGLQIGTATIASLGGKKCASGTVNTSGLLQIRNLAFKPSIIITFDSTKSEDANYRLYSLFVDSSIFPGRLVSVYADRYYSNNRLIPTIFDDGFSFRVDVQTSPVNWIAFE